MALGVAVIAAIMLVAMALNHERQQAAENHAAAHQEASKSIPARRVPTPLADPHPDRKEWREEQNLRAQRHIAQWAFWAFVVSGFGVVVSISAVGLVWGSLQAALAANRGFARASQQQLTAYVLGVDPKICQIFTQKDHTTYRLRLTLELKNSGQTPALELFNVCKVAWATESDFSTWVIEMDPSSRAVVGPGSSVFVVETMKDGAGNVAAFTNDLLKRLIDAKCTVWLKGHLVYRDVDGRRWRHDYSWCLRDLDLLLAAPEAEDGKWKRRDLSMFANATGNDLRIIDDAGQKT